MELRETVLIIGGAGFFGQAAMEKFLHEGYDVVIADVMPPEKGAIPFYKMDATNPESILAARHLFSRNRVVFNHLINLTGERVESGLSNLFDTTAEEIDQTWERNLKAQLYPVRFLGEVMTTVPGDKSITLMSSINAQAGYSIPFYTAAKGGIEAFVRPAAVDLGRYGIRVNAVAPGSVITPRTVLEPKDFEARAQAAPLGWLAQADDVAEAFLSVVRMKAFTGQTLTVDCGQSITPAESLYHQHRRMGLDR